MSTLGSRLREARDEARGGAGVSQQIVADECGVTREAVSQWETDGTTPTLDNLRVCARLYDVGLDWLIEGIGPMKRSDNRTQALQVCDRLEGLLDQSRRDLS